MSGDDRRGGKWRRGTAGLFVGALALGFPGCDREARAERAMGALDEPMRARIAAVLTREEPRFIALRRDLHRNPEVSFEEARTARVVADAMRDLGLEVRTGVGGHGVTALLRGARPGPTVAYRADMDAVASNDPDPVDFRSLRPGVRHICGHDIHTTIGVALATALHAVRDSLAGNVLFLFQPAEERVAGAKAMLEAGVFATPPAAIYGLHTSPYPVGQVATTPGAMMAGRDRFEVTITAPGSSGDLTAAIQAVKQKLESLSTIPAGQAVVPRAPDFIFMQLLPETVEGATARIRGIATVATDVERQRVRDVVTAGLLAVVARDVRVTATYEPRWAAGVTNDSALTVAATAAARDVLGAPNVQKVATIPPAFSEDFGSFQERVPGVFFYLGVANAQRGWSGMPHSPDYVADEGAIVIGARVMSEILLRHLGGTK